MSYNTRKDFRRQIIILIAKGKNNDEIWKAVGCNRKYPGIIRKELKQMSEEERNAAITEAIEKDEEPKQKPKQKDTGLHTPYKQAKGKYIPSHY